MLFQYSHYWDKLSVYILLYFLTTEWKTKITTDESWFKISESEEETKADAETHYSENLNRNPLSNTKKTTKKKPTKKTNSNNSNNSLMEINKNEINNNIIKSLFNVAFSVSVPERGLCYLKFQSSYAFLHIFS